MYRIFCLYNFLLVISIIFLHPIPSCMLISFLFFSLVYTEIFFFLLSFLFVSELLIHLFSFYFSTASTFQTSFDKLATTLSSCQSHHRHFVLSTLFHASIVLAFCLIRLDNTQNQSSTMLKIYTAYIVL